MFCFISFRKLLRNTTVNDCHRLVLEREVDSLAEQNRLQHMENGWGSIQRTGPNRFPSDWNQNPLPLPVVVPMRTGPTNSDRRNMRAWLRSHQNVTQTTHTRRQPYQTLLEVYGRHLNSVSEQDKK